MGGVEATQAIEAHKLDHFVECLPTDPEDHGAPVRVEDGELMASIRPGPGSRRPSPAAF